MSYSTFIDDIGLYEFQLEDVIKLRDVPGCLIASEMGVGKTYEGVALDIARRIDQGELGPHLKTLVIAPLSVCSIWKEHFEDICTKIGYPLKVAVIETPAAKRKSFIADKFKTHQILCVHWDVLRLMPELVQQGWFHIIVDECHRMQNRKAKMTIALKKIPTKFKTALSGTPTTDAPHKFWSVLNWLYPKQWSSYWKYYGRYVDFEIVYPQGYHKITGPRNVEELHKLIAPYYVRHLKKRPCCKHHPQGVLPQLPDKYYSKRWVELTPSQRKMYDDMKKEMVSWLDREKSLGNLSEPLIASAVVSQLVRLQQFACAAAELSPTGHVLLAEPSSKVDALIELIEDNPDQQFVVFSSFKQLVNLAVKRLDKEGISSVVFTGDTPAKDRSNVVQQFQDGKAQVFIGTIQAGGVGITLTASSTVIFLDRTWSPAQNLQAEDRLHRIGQKDHVQVIDIMARDTVDLGKHAKLEMKLDWLRRLLNVKV